MAKRDSKGRFLPAKKKAGGGKSKKGAAAKKSGGAKASSSSSTALVKAGTIRNEAGAAVPAVLVGGAAFLGVRLLTFFGLGVNKTTGERRDKGWLGYLGNAIVLVLGWLALRSFGPTKKYAMAWLIGGGIAIVARGIAQAWPQQAERAGLSTSDPPAQLGSGEAAPGVAGIHEISMRGMVNASRLKAA